MITPRQQTIITIISIGFVTALGCRASSPLGSDPAPSLDITTQPSSIEQDGGTYTRGPDVTDVYAGCPTAVAGAVDGQPCGLPKNTVCDYQMNGSFVSCSCIPTALGNLWACGGEGSGQGQSCPTSRPVIGSSCGGEELGRSCSYVRPLADTCAADRNNPFRRAIACTCDKDAGTWSCTNAWPAMEGRAETTFLETPCYGTGVSLARPQLDEDTTIADMTVDEVAAWCDWFVSTNQGAGPPPPSTPPEILADGSPNGFGFISCLPGGAGQCVSFVPATYCQKLLRYGACDQPVRSLDDCFLSIRNQCENVGGGCEAMGLDPKCRQTVVQLGSWKSKACPHLPVKW